MDYSFYLDNYLNNYLDYIIKNNSDYYVENAINRILNCKEVLNLTHYSRELLALAMEKRLVKSIENDNTTTSFWYHIKQNAPLLYNSDNDLSQYIKPYVFNHNKELPNTESLKDIESFYNNIINKTFDMFRTKSFNDTYISDLLIDLGKSLSNKDLKTIYSIKKYIETNKNNVLRLSTVILFATLIGASKSKDTKEFIPKSKTINNFSYYDVEPMNPYGSYVVYRNDYYLDYFNMVESTEEEKLEYRVRLMAKEIPELGFSLSFDNKKYILSDDDKKLFYAVVCAESDKTYDDSLAVASSILNRCEDEAWVRSYGDDPIDQIKAPRQYSVYLFGSYKTYYDDTPIECKNACDDALNGARNNDYLCFTANRNSNGGNKMITLSGNRYYRKKRD